VVPVNPSLAEPTSPDRPAADAERLHSHGSSGAAPQAGLRRALLIAFHYPPCSESSGLQRSLCLSRDLRDLGWSPTVLTAHPRAYRETRPDQLAQVPPEILVHRAFALDTQRHLGLRGRYPGWMALPDSWVTWLAGAIPAGLRLIRKLRPDVIWSTYPLATTHLVGLALHRLTGVPWVADFRDPMTEVDPLTQQRFPTNPRLWSVRQWAEKQTIRHCQRAVFVTHGALTIYRERYPDRAADMRLVENGYDEENFAAVERARESKPREPGPLVLVHSGTLYPGPDRDSNGLLAALARLRTDGKISSATLQVRFRAAGFDDVHREQIARYEVGDLVTLAPSLPYQAALEEMLEADGLLLFQGRTSNPAIPAKLYEYLRARRPIFALVDEQGETATVLRNAKIGTRVPLDSTEAIAAGLLSFLEQVRVGRAVVATTEEIECHSRKTKAAEMACVFEELCKK
jgi:glycosyltransferase involved in cell wall biosynthesis